MGILGLDLRMIRVLLGVSIRVEFGDHLGQVRRPAVGDDGKYMQNMPDVIEVQAFELIGQVHWQVRRPVVGDDGKPAGYANGRVIGCTHRHAI